MGASTDLMEVRRLTVADLAEYRALHRYGMIESPLAIVDTTETDAAVSDEYVADVLKRGDAWGVFLETRMVGKLAIDALPYPSLAHTFWVHAVYVHPDGRGTGASIALMRAAIEGARERGATRVALWVNGENPHAHRLYERLGFRESGRIPGGIFVGGKQCDDVLMSLVLE
jgi:GNAT superfamily N-acetyltransferase